MLTIKENNLRDLLNRRTQFIKTHKGFVEAGIGLIVFIMSLALADIKSRDLFTQIIIYLLTVFYIALTVYSFKDCHYSAEKFYNDIVSTSESKEHNFSLVVIKDKKNKYGKYLLEYNNRWKCYLFPFLRTRDNGDIDSIKDFLEHELLLKDYSIGETKEEDFTKVSVSANLTKTYHHIFYPVEIDVTDTKLNSDKFVVNKNKYKWFTIEEMKTDKDIYEKNMDNVTYIEKYL